MIFEESHIRFDFSETEWKAVLQYDSLVDYTNLQKALSDSKGVDFIGIDANDNIVLIEVKNFLNREVDLRFRIMKEDDILLNSIAKKVRDTLANILASSRNSTHNRSFFRDCAKIIMDKNSQVNIVFWLEPNPTTLVANRQRKSIIPILNRKLKNKLKWLTGRVSILSEDTNIYPITTKKL